MEEFQTYFSMADHMYDMDFATGINKTVVPQSYKDDLENQANEALNQFPAWMVKFYEFYQENIIVISALQWVVLLIILIKLSKKQ